MKGGRFVLKRKIERSLRGGGGWGEGGGGSKKRTSVNKGGGSGSKNHPIYANVITEWSLSWNSI